MSVNLTLYNCSDQEILIVPETAYNRYGDNTTYYLEFQKNRGEVQMHTRNKTIELFKVLYDEFCPIRKYQIYDFNETFENRRKIEQENFLVPRFNSSIYIEDGNIML